MTQVTYWLKAWANSRGAELDSRFRIGREQKMYYRVVQWPCTTDVQTVQSVQEVQHNDGETRGSDGWIPIKGEMEDF